MEALLNSRMLVGLHATLTTAGHPQASLSTLQTRDCCPAGALMMVNATKIPWHDITHAVPAFLTIAVMPFTYSIAYGVIAGIVSFAICWTSRIALNWVSDKTGGRLGGHHTVHEDIDHVNARTQAAALMAKDDSAHMVRSLSISSWMKSAVVYCACLSTVHEDIGHSDA